MNRYSSEGYDHYTAADFYRVKKVDAHFHLNYQTPAVGDLLEKDNFRLLTINVDVPYYSSLEKQQEIALAYIRELPGKVDFLTAFTLYNWNSASWADDTIALLKASFEKGALGVKLWKNIGMTDKDAADNFIMLDDPKFDPVIDYAIQEGKAVLNHMAEPRNCWLPVEKMTVNNDREYFTNHPEFHMFLHPEYPSYEHLISVRNRFLEKHKDMRYIGAHLGTQEWSVDELAASLDRFPGMAVDTAARMSHLQYQSVEEHDKVRQFLIKYQDRVIYGSDGVVEEETQLSSIHEQWLTDWKFLATDETIKTKQVKNEFKGMKLPKEIIDKLYFHNAVRWYGI